MAGTRLDRLFAARTTVRGDAIFGEVDLVPANVTLAPVERVAILAEAFLPKVDGVSKTTYFTVRYLQETGRDVLIFAPDISVPAVGSSEVVPLPSVAVPGVEETRLALPNPIIARRLEEFKPDLIHLCSPAAMAVSGMAVGRHLNVPVIANYQTDLPGYAAQYGFPMLSRPMRHWLRYIHNGCHLTLVPTRSIHDQLQKWGYRRLRMWGRGVNIERFSPDHKTGAMREYLLNGRDPNSLLCIYVGRLANEKRVDLLYDVAKTEGVSLAIIGDGTRREDLENLFADTDTFFTGYLVGDQLAQAFASADVFCFAGPNETFGQVIQEAMASGLPCVVTNQGAVGDLVEEGVTGFVCRPKPQFFADAVARLRDDRALVRWMSYNARTQMLQRPWSAMMARLEDYYQEACEINQRFVDVFGKTTYHMPISLPTRFQRWR